MPKMTVSELHNKLKEIGINEDQYFLHGLYGSTDDNEKLALSIKQGKYSIIFETYYRERGEKHSIRTFTAEKEACEFIFKKLIVEQTFNRIPILMDFPE